MNCFNRKSIKLIGFLLTMAIISLGMAGCGLVKSTSSENSQIGSIDLQSIDNTSPDLASEDSVTPEVQGKKLTMELYFPEKENGAVIAEKRELNVVNGAVLRAAVEGLIAGPESDNLLKPLPEGTKLLGINLKNDLVIVDFSNEFSKTGVVSFDAEKISLVDTLTGFEGINKVKILIEGYDWKSPSGEPYGEMTKIQLDDQGIPLN